MSFSQAELDALDRMIASGVLEAEYDGKRMKYDSFAQLRNRRRMIADALAAETGQRPARFTNPTFDRGV